jgi:hypothetical protein
MTKKEDLDKKSEELLNEVRQIGVFRRGSLNSIYRKCGKARCVCNQKNHPGHGPQTTLTYKVRGKSRIRNLASPAEIELVREQIANHDRFQDWCRRWQELKEKEADMKLEQVKTASGNNEEKHQKKLRGRSRKKSSGRSKA